MYDTDEIKAALLILVADPNAQALHTMLRKTISLAGQLPIKLTGEAANMNPLLWLATHDAPTFGKHLEVVDTLRVRRGFAPLASGFDKTDYQAGFMAQGRLRRSRASTLENMQRPARDKLRGGPRLEFERIAQTQWKKQLDAQMTTARKASGGKLPIDDFKALIVRFWAAVDVALDEKEAQVRRDK